MRVAGLFSGGKDSTYASRKAQELGMDLAYLVSVKPVNPESYMFHTVNLHVTELQAEAWGVPYIELETQGEKEAEVLDLKEGLSRLDVEGVVSGAIESSYQRVRVDKICSDLSIEHFSPFWGRAGESLLKEMLERGMKVIFSAVAAYGLDETWLGEALDGEKLGRLVSLNKEFGVDVCGEGGEYESLVLDAPWFNYRIKILDAEKTWDGTSGRYNVKRARLVKKIHKD